MPQELHPQPVVFISYRHAYPDQDVARTAARRLRSRYRVFIDADLDESVDATMRIDEALEDADVLVAFVSEAALASRWVTDELRTAYERYQSEGRPRVVQVVIGATLRTPYALRPYLQDSPRFTWVSDSDNESLLQFLEESIARRHWTPEDEGAILGDYFSAFWTRMKHAVVFPPRGLADAEHTPFFVEIWQMPRVRRLTSGGTSAGVSTWAEFRKQQREPSVLIIGEPGSGKSWLLLWEAARLGASCRSVLDRDGMEAVGHIPVLVSLPRLLETLRGRVMTPERVIESACQLASEWSGSGGALAQLLRNFVRNGQAVLLLDAWDEMESTAARNTTVGDADSRYVLREMLRKVQERTGSSTLITTRPLEAGYGAPAVEVKLQILPLELEQVVGAVKVWFTREPEQVPRVLAFVRENARARAMAGNTMTLALLCKAFEHGTTSQSPTRGELIGSCIRNLIRDWQSASKHRHVMGPLEADAFVAHLARYAFALFPSESFTPREFASALEGTAEPLPALSTWRDEEANIQLCVSTGILVYDGPMSRTGSATHLRFLHRQFHEYLAAEAFKRALGSARPLSVEDAVERCCADRRWFDVLVLLAGLTQERAPAVISYLLASDDSDSIFRCRLALAALCIAECKPAHVEQILPVVIEAVINFARDLVLREILPAFPDLQRVLRTPLFTEHLMNKGDLISSMMLIQSGAAGVNSELVRNLQRTIGDNTDDGVASAKRIDAIGALCSLAPEDQPENLVEMLVSRLQRLDDLELPPVFRTREEAVKDAARRSAEWRFRMLELWAVLEGLAEIGPRAAVHEVVTRMRRHATDPTSALQVTAARVLEKLQVPLYRDEDVPAILAALERDDTDAVAETLWQLSQSVGGAPPVLRDAVAAVLRRELERGTDASRAQVRRLGASCLAHLSNQTPDAALDADLEVLLRTAPPECWTDVAWARGKQKDRPLPRELVTALLDASADTRTAAAAFTALASLADVVPREAAQDIVRRAIAATSHEEAHVRAEALYALRKYAAPHKRRELAPLFSAMLRDADPSVVQNAADAFRSLEPTSVSRDDVAQLRGLLEARDSDLRESAMAALRRLQWEGLIA